MSAGWGAPCPAAQALRREEIRLEKQAERDRLESARSKERAREADQRADRQLGIQLAVQAAELETGYECLPGQAEFLTTLLEKLLPQ